MKLRQLLSIDGAVLVLLPIIVLFSSLLWRPNFLISILLFLGLPVAYMVIRAPKYILKTLIFSLIASIPLMIILEYIGQQSLSWAFPPSAFDSQFLGIINFEVLLWAFFNILAIVLFYEFIFDHHRVPKPWHKKMWILVRYLAVWGIFFLLLFQITGGDIRLPYFYLLFGLIVFIYPILMTAFQYPRLLPKILYTALYFAFLSLLYEIAALKLGWWYFPGKEFIGYITILQVTFPLEELFFWIILFAPAVVSAFEYLDDDHR